MGGFLHAEAGGSHSLVNLNVCGPYQNMCSLSHNLAVYQTSVVSTHAWQFGDALRWGLGCMPGSLGEQAGGNNQ